MTQSDAGPPTDTAPGRFPEAPPARRRARGAGSFLAELPVLILIAFVLALLMKTFLVQAFFIPSSSMEPTLEINDRVLVNKLTANWREPQRGEVVVFSEASIEEQEGNPVSRFFQSLVAGLGLAPPAEKDFIKRVIGLPGETLEMRDGVVLIDGEPLTEAPTAEGGYLSARHYTDYGPVTLGEDEYFMMGDNRPSSADSRSFGPIPGDQVIGRAFVVIWPFGRLDTLPIADYGPEAAADEVRARLPRQADGREAEARASDGRVAGRSLALPGEGRGHTPGIAPGVRGHTPGIDPGVRGHTPGIAPGVRGHTPGIAPGVRGHTPGIAPGVRGHTPGLDPGVRGHTPGLDPGVR